MGIKNNNLSKLYPLSIFIKLIRSHAYFSIEFFSYEGLRQKLHKFLLKFKRTGHLIKCVIDSRYSLLKQFLLN